MTGAPVILNGLKDVAARYDALLCDVWGVVHNGRAVFPGAEAALTGFRKERGPVILLTNAPRPAHIIPAQLDRLGLPREAYDAVVTSGDATTAELASRGDLKAFKIGPDKDEELYRGLTPNFVELGEADYIICTGLYDDIAEQPDDYRPLLQDAAARKLPMLCANPDIIVKFGDRTLWCAGALADIYAQLGGEVIFTGKPHKPIYDLAYKRIAEITGAPVSKERILAVGDGLGTDIAGANAEGLDVIFIADGIHGGPARNDAGRLDTRKLKAMFAEEGRRALGALEQLRWTAQRGAEAT